MPAPHTVAPIRRSGYVALRTMKLPSVNVGVKREPWRLIAMSG